MKLNIFLLFVASLLLSCSRYAINEDGTDGTDNINVYINFQKNAVGDILDIDYPVRIYCVDKTSSVITDFNYLEGEGIVATLIPGEYSINAFLGIGEESYSKVNDISGKPIIAVNGSGVSDIPLMAAHSSINLEKQTEINLIPSYIVASLEFEFTNIPSEVKKIQVEVSPVSCGYQIEGGFSDRTQAASLECNLNNGKWLSGQKFIFPAEGVKTSVIVILDYGDEIKKYSYTFAEGLSVGQPYKFTGGYDEDLSMDGDFQISAWKMEEEIVMDFENEKPADDENDENEQDGEDEESDGSSFDEDIDVFYVKTMPSANKIWGPFYLWKLEEIGVGEARATIISPDQWYQIYEEG